MGEPRYSQIWTLTLTPHSVPHTSRAYILASSPYQSRVVQGTVVHHVYYLLVYFTTQVTVRHRTDPPNTAGGDPIAGILMGRCNIPLTFRICVNLDTTPLSNLTFSCLKTDNMSL